MSLMSLILEIFSKNFCTNIVLEDPHRRCGSVVTTILTKNSTVIQHLEFPYYFIIVGKDTNSITSHLGRQKYLSKYFDKIKLSNLRVKSLSEKTRQLE